MITKEQAIDILTRFDFFQGQRAGRELWNNKPFDVQEKDIATFSRDVDLLKEYINTADVVPKSEVDRLNAVMKEMDEQRAYTINMLGESLEKAKSEVAREIFEEIEFDIHQLMFERDETRAIAIEGIIAELKKKYTEK